jgi:predicted RND superfamily exporter protein
MIIYIVLGIAADDIFVFYDAYQQSSDLDTRIMDTKEKRLAYAFRRAVRAMAITSSTTAVAFFANAFSPLINISAFGIFAGVIVPINYFLVVMIFPPAVVWYEENILLNERFRWCICWGRCMKSKKDSGEALGRVERFYDEKINSLVGHKIGKWCIIGVSAVWFALAIYFTSQIEPLSEQEEFIDPDNELMETFTLIGEQFGENSPR